MSRSWQSEIVKPRIMYVELKNDNDKDNESDNSDDDSDADSSSTDVSNAALHSVSEKSVPRSFNIVSI